MKTNAELALDILLSGQISALNKELEYFTSEEQAQALVTLFKILLDNINAANSQAA